MVQAESSPMMVSLMFSSMLWKVDLKDESLVKKASESMIRILAKKRLFTKRLSVFLDT